MRAKQNNISTNMELVYNSFCVAGFIGTALWCITVFFLNHDICLVDIREYNDDLDNVYPSISIMIVNPFLDNRLKEYGDNITAVNYSKFLAGMSVQRLLFILLLFS